MPQHLLPQHVGEVKSGGGQTCVIQADTLGMKMMKKLEVMGKDLWQQLNRGM